MKTTMQKTAEVKREWHLIDLKDDSLGRVATRIAKLLIGKHKASYTPHIEGGDFVVAINSDLLVLTGNKLDDKVYARHSGRPGGFKQETARTLMSRDSRKLVEKAVSGMLPKNKLHDLRLRRLRVFAGDSHPHANHFNKQKEK